MGAHSVSLRDARAARRAREPALGARCFVELLRARAESEGGRPAFRHRHDGEPEAALLTYAELDARARAIGGVLADRAPPGSRALLLYPPGLEFVEAFFGCLYAGHVAVPAYPPEPGRPSRAAARLRAIVADAEARAVLTTGALARAREALVGADALLLGSDWIATDEIGGREAAGWRPPPGDGGRAALLQYTSGSTGTPRGVLLGHEQLLHNSARIRECFGHTRRSHGVIWLPSYHDMGLIGGVLQPVFAGFPVTTLSPLDFLKRPLRWLELVSEAEDVTSGGPDFAFDLCVRRTTPEQRARLDLSGWRVAFTGAEPVRARTLERFVAAFAPCGFRREAFLPCYGLAEATLIVSGDPAGRGPRVLAVRGAELVRGRAVAAPAGAPDATSLVACGRPVAHATVEIVDPGTRALCAPGAVGEVWVSSPSVGRGYWRRPEETERSFRAALVPDDGRRFLRTGDLGFLREGRLFVRGRLKDTLVLRGRTLAPEDLEGSAQRAHPALRAGCGACFAVEEAESERVVLVQEVRAGAEELPAVADAIAEAVAAEHGVPLHEVVLIAPRTLPKTSSGKVRRSACREAYRSGALARLGGARRPVRSRARVPPTRGPEAPR